MNGHLLNAKNRIAVYALTFLLVVLTIVSDLFNYTSDNMLLGSSLLVAALLIVDRLLVGSGNERSNQDRTESILITASLILFFIIYFIHFLFAAPTFLSFCRFFLWFWYLLVYQLSRNWPQQTILSSQVFVLVILSVVVLSSPTLSFILNKNILSFICIGILISVEPVLGKMKWPIFAIIAASMLVAKRAGACIALLAAYVHRLRAGLKIILIVGIATFLAYELWYGRRTAISRIAMWEVALADFFSAPMFGQGTNWMMSYFFDYPRKIIHAHNFIFTTLAQTGIVGLIPVILLVVAFIRDWANLQLSSRGLILAFGVWCLVDEPLLWIGSGTIFFMNIQYNQSSELKT